ncbi:MAG: sulfatase-like hydrolase/transferase [Chloroflexi bacterium]|nr:sulfatase-like hydrolase/transferase [Chloroflexota bacterium]
MNLLIIMSDEHTRRMTGCYGHPQVKTPNLDRLAADGVRFDNAYCNFPICVPSRANFLTGRYCHETGHWDNAHPYVGHEAPSWGHRLAANGNQVTSIGKLHYRADEDDNGIAEKRVSMNVRDGIGDVRGSIRWNMPPSQAPAFDVLQAHAGDSEYIRFDTAVADETVRWLGDDATSYDRPWVLFASVVTPHFPFICPQRHWDLYDVDEVEMPLSHESYPDHPYWNRVRPLRMSPPDGSDRLPDEAVRRGITAYWGLISFMDEQVGRILDAVDANGWRENTRIIYTSDHGEMAGSFGLWGKSSHYEDAVGVPFIMSGPDLPAGETRSANVSFIDFFPTVLDAVGAPAAAEDSDLPGTSLWPVARGESDPQRTVFAEYHASGAICGSYMVRDQRYKYVHYADPQFPAQLFDLDNDPRELCDLGSDPSHAGVRARLHLELLDICDPAEVNSRAFADQRALVERNGGEEHIVANYVKIPYTPAPAAFGPEKEPFQ